MRKTGALSLSAIVVACAVLGGCRIGGTSDVSSENDRLRLQAVELSERIKALEGETAELKVKLAEADYVREVTLSSDALEALPRATGIKIERISGLTPNDSTLPATAAVVYLAPHDGRDRFVQVVGTLNVEVLLVPASVGGGNGEEPRRIGSVSLTPAQVRDAYREGVLGIHYSIEVPVDTPIDRSGGQTPTTLLRAEFLDALTGQVHRSERLIPGRRVPSLGSRGQ